MTNSNSMTKCQTQLTAENPSWFMDFSARLEHSGRGSHRGALMGKDDICRPFERGLRAVVALTVSVALAMSLLCILPGAAQFSAGTAELQALTPNQSALPIALLADLPVLPHAFAQHLDALDRILLGALLFPNAPSYVRSGHIGKRRDGAGPVSQSTVPRNHLIEGLLSTPAFVLTWYSSHQSSALPSRYDT